MAEPMATDEPRPSAGRNIFVLIDGSPESHAMWKQAQGTFQAGDHVKLVTIAEVDTNWAALAQGEAVMGITTLTNGTAPVNKVEEQEIAEATKQAQELLESLKAEASPEGWTLDSEVVVMKKDVMSVGQALTRYLKAHHEADEAIIGHKDMSFFKKKMMGLVGDRSVSDYVVANAPCHVEVIHSS